MNAAAPALDPSRWHTTTIQRGGGRFYRLDHCRGCLRMWYLPTTAKEREQLDYDARLLGHQSECALREGSLP